MMDVSTRSESDAEIHILYTGTRFKVGAEIDMMDVCDRFESDCRIKAGGDRDTKENW